MKSKEDVVNYLVRKGWIDLSHEKVVDVEFFGNTDNVVADEHFDWRVLTVSTTVSYRIVSSYTYDKIDNEIIYKVLR